MKELKKELKTKYYQEKLSELPNEGFAGIEYLDLSQNTFTDLDFAEYDVTALQVLDISYNKKKLKMALDGAQCPDLKHLYLYQSNLKALHLTGSFPELCTLHLAENQLINFEFPDAPNLKTLYLYGNDKLQNVPLELIGKERENVVEGVRNYFRTLSFGGVVMNRGKIVFVGNGRVGKSTLSDYLRSENQTINKNFEPTYGIELKEWKIGIKDEDCFDSIREKIAKEIADYKSRYPNSRIEDFSNEVFLNLWDFGGQEYFHATHRLFWTDDTMYFLLWSKAHEKQDLVKGDYPKKYWEQNIQHFAKNPKIFWIQTKDEGAYRNLNDLKFPLADFNDEEQYKEDANVIVRKLHRSLHEIEGIGVVRPKAYFDVLAKIYKDDKKIWKWDDFIVFCKQIGGKALQTDGEIETMLRLFDKIGAIVSFRFRDNVSALSMKDYVFTDPAWLTESIYKILDSEVRDGQVIKVQKGNTNGEFDITHVKDKLGEILPKDAALFAEPLDWIALMKAFELVFEITQKNESVFVAPQFLEQECPNQDRYDEVRDYVNYKFCVHYPEFLPNSTFLRFIARYGNAQRNNLYWRNGLGFKVKDENNAPQIAFAECLPEKRLIKIYTQGKSEVVMKELFESLLEIDPDSTHDIQVSVDDTHYVQFEKLKKHPPQNPLIPSESGVNVYVDGYNFALPQKAKISPEPFDLSTMNFAYVCAQPQNATNVKSGDEFVKLTAVIQGKISNIVTLVNDAKRKDFIDNEILKTAQVVHFVGHGSQEGLYLLDEKSNAKLLENDELADLFKSSIGAKKLVFLNSCFSDAQANAIAEHTDYMILLKQAIKSTNAITFTEKFYAELIKEKDIRKAFMHARNSSNEFYRNAVFYKDGKIIST